jgi:predicted RND superfamily exporter protein
MKKEISDHIASTFFEKKKKPPRKKDRKSLSKRIVLFLLTALFILAAIKVLATARVTGVHVGRRLGFVKHDGPFRLNYNFLNRATSKIETLTIDIPEIDLREYKAIRFSLRMMDDDNQKDGIVKVSLSNRRKETSSLYIQNIGPSWKVIEIPRENFRSLNDWSQLNQLTFTVEEWNLRRKSGVLLIDGVEFVK